MNFGGAGCRFVHASGGGPSKRTWAAHRCPTSDPVLDSQLPLLPLLLLRHVALLSPPLPKQIVLMAGAITAAVPRILAHCRVYYTPVVAPTLVMWADHDAAFLPQMFEARTLCLRLLALAAAAVPRIARLRSVATL